MTRYPKLTIALAVVAALSVTLNLLIFSSFVGEKAGRPRHMERGLMTQMIGSVPPEVRAELRERLRARRDEIRSNFRDMREARTQISAVLGEDDYSEVALSDALSALRLQTDTAQALIHAAMIETAGALTAEQRRAWAERQWRRRRLPSEDIVEPDNAKEADRSADGK
jgi:uncharacterized membrane protein